MEKETTVLSAQKIAYSIYPAQPPVSKSLDAKNKAPFIYNEPLYNSTDFLPESTVVIADTGQIRAHEFVQIKVYPLSYAPGDGLVKIIKRVKFRVDFKGGDRTATKRAITRYFAPDIDAFARSTLINFDDIIPRAKKYFNNSPEGYLIIVPDALLKGIEPFAEFKRSLGFNVTVTPLSALSTNTSAGIRDYIQSVYKNAATAPTFVLLVGDTDLLPCFSRNIDPEVLTTDLFYTTMDGPNDIFPDILIGRFSVDDLAQLKTVVNKTIAYSTFNLTGETDWIKRVLFMASKEHSDISEASHNYTVDTWMDPLGYESLKRFCDTGHAVTSQVLDDINKGVSFITYSGHGLWNGWYDGPPLGPPHMPFIDNDKMWPVVLSYACSTGAYIADDCFAETWMSGIGDNGAVAFWGSSVDTTWGEDDILQRGVFDALFADGYTRLRAFLNQGLWDVYEHYAGEGMSRRYFEQYNLLGDPSLSPWTEVPSKLIVKHKQTFYLYNDTFKATVLALDSTPVAGALVSIRIGRNIHSVAYTNSSGNVTIPMEPNYDAQAKITISATAHNFIPYFGTAFFIEQHGLSGDCDCLIESNADTGLLHLLF